MVLRMTLGVLLCAASCLAAAGQQNLFPFAFTQEDLPNGLRLITIPTEFPNLVTVYIVVQAGSRNEVEAGKSGFAHLFEHLMFRGTPNYPPEKYHAIIREIGATQNAYTEDDLTAFHTTFSKDDLETVLRLEADRFQHLKYSPELYKTETLAVLGEYNKNSAEPMEKLSEAVRDTAFSRHPYKHTTMGFLKDVQAMPEEYDYSLRFFADYYRPEYTTLIVAGDVSRAKVRSLADRYWSHWKRGRYRPAIPAERPQDQPRKNQVDWPTPTLPWLVVAYKAPAYSDQDPDWVALRLISYLGFSENSPLFQTLVIQQQKVDQLSGELAMRVDPYLFNVAARLKRHEDINYVQQQILSTLEEFTHTAVEPERLEAVQHHLRYDFALDLDNTEAVASTAATFVALRRTPETINRVFALAAKITPEDIRRVAQKYFVPAGQTIVTLTGPGGKAR